MIWETENSLLWTDPRYHLVRNYGQPIQVENGPQKIVTRKAEASVLQPQENVFRLNQQAGQRTLSSKENTRFQPRVPEQEPLSCIDQTDDLQQLWDGTFCCFIPQIHSIFIRIYQLFRGDSLWQFQIGLYYTLARSSPPFLPLNPIHTPLKATARGCFVLFHISIWSSSTIYLHLHLHSPSPLPLTPYHTYSVTILQTFLLFLSPCSKGFLNVSPVWIYFGLFRPFHCSPLVF
jgi:hypothetical protein